MLQMHRMKELTATLNSEIGAKKSCSDKEEKASSEESEK